MTRQRRPIPAPFASFQLIGRPTMTFRVVEAYELFPDASRKVDRCPCVRGVWEGPKGKLGTTARVADVIAA